MRTRPIIWLAALAAMAALVAAAAAAAGHGQPAARGATPGHDHSKHRGKRQERYPYVSTIAQSKTDPDFIAVVGADPSRRDFGRIVNRVDMPNVGDELHHYGYSQD